MAWLRYLCSTTLYICLPLSKIKYRHLINYLSLHTRNFVWFDNVYLCSTTLFTKSTIFKKTIMYSNIQQLVQKCNSCLFCMLNMLNICFVYVLTDCNHTFTWNRTDVLNYFEISRCFKIERQNQNRTFCRRQ